MRRLLLSLLGVVVSVFVVNAGKVTEQQALQKAKQFLKGKSLSVVNPKAASRSGESAYADAFYIFNAENKGGFVIVSADDRTEPILGYSLSGQIDWSQAPENFKYWLESYVKQLNALPVDYKNEATHGTRMDMEAIEPLIETTWDQSQPYNLMCPVDDGQNCVTGCVAVALAQVMYYYKYPQTSPAIPGYNTYFSKINVEDLPPTTFKWDLMKPSYDYDETGESADAVAELLRYSGQINEMDYAISGSSAGILTGNLISAFGYSKNMQEVYRDYYTNSQWDQMIYNELYNRRPVLYSGASARSGHQFVCDGYDGAGRFHLNWGWGGYCDGYFILSVANPYGRGIGGGNSSEGYSSGQSAVIGFMPSVENEQSLPQMWGMNVGVGASEYTRPAVGQYFENVQIKGSIYVSYNVTPTSELNIDVESGWGLFQKDKFLKCLGYVTNALPIGQYDSFNNDMTLMFGSDIEDGKYQIYPIYRLKGETEWCVCINTTRESLVAEVNGTQLNIRKIDSATDNYVVDEVDYSEDPEIGSKLELTVKLTNIGETVQHLLYFWTQENGVWKLKSLGIAYLDTDDSGLSILSYTPDVAGTFDVKITSDESGNDVKYTSSISIADVGQITVNGIIYSLNMLTKNAKVIDSDRDQLESSVVIPPTVLYNDEEFCVKSIQPGAFFNSYPIVNLIISEGVQSIEEGAFEYSYKLASVDIPSTVTKIGDYAFAYCSGLSSVTSRMENPIAISDKVFEVINESSKENTSATLYVPIGSIDKYRMADGWKKFGTIYEGELRETTIDGINYSYVTGSKVAILLSGDPTSSDMTIPSAIEIDGGDYSVITIAQNAFFNKNILENIIIPEGIKTIENSAFRFCFSLKSVEIPSSLTHIGDYAFGGCEYLVSVVSHQQQPIAINNKVFGSSQWNEDYTIETILPPSATLYVPYGAKDAYREAEGWKEFPNIVEMDASDTGTTDDREKQAITIGKSGKASYCGDKSLDFSFSDEVKAYIATGFDKDEGTIWLTRVKDVPAGVPVLIKGDANKTYDVPVTDSQNSYYTNMFVGNTSGEKMVIQETDGDMLNYYLSGDGTFKSVNKTANIGTNKCYLQLPRTFEAAATGATQTVKVGSIGKASFAAPVDLDFTNVSGLKAFTATGYDKSTKTIWLTRVMKVQKGEGVLLKGDPNSYEIPSVAVQSSYENMFISNTSGEKIQIPETSEDGSLTNYYLSGKDGSFVSVNGSAKIGDNKCYLALPTSMVAISSTRSLEDELILEEAEMIQLPIDFKSIESDEDGTTSIKDLTPALSEGEGEWYTLQGQRVAKPGKGLYIKNGKKVVVK